jgi:hypothetical protein
MDGVNTLITNIYNAITNIENDITTLETAVTNIENDITTIQNQITTIQGDITSINNFLSTVPILTTQSFSENFRANGYIAGAEDRIVYFYGQKIGSIVTLSFQKHFWNFVANSNNWTINTPLPVGWHPFSNSQALFSSMTTGTEDADNNVDILGMIWINTNGDIVIYKEAPPGTGEWGTAIADGFRAFSITYRAA